jgi:hypothetical protein
MATLSQFFVSGSGGGQGIGDIIYRFPGYDDSPLHTREDGSVFLRTGSLLPYSSEYNDARQKIPGTFYTAHTELSTTLRPSGDNTVGRYVYQSYMATGSYGSIRYSANSSVNSSYTQVGSYGQIIDWDTIAGNIVVSGWSLDGSTTSARIGYVNTTTNVYSTVTLAANANGLLASNGNVGYYLGVSYDGSNLSIGGANMSSSTNGTSWTSLPATTNHPNPYSWFWSPAGGKFILPCLSGGGVEAEYLSIRYWDGSGWWLANDPYLATSTSTVSLGTGSKTFVVSTGPYSENQKVSMYVVGGFAEMTGNVTSYNSTTNELVVDVTSTVGTANTYSSWEITRYDNTKSISASTKYPGLYFNTTPWKNMYATSNTVTLFTMGLYKAIVRTTDAVNYTVVDLSSYLDDGVTTTVNPIYLHHDGNNFILRYGAFVLYSSDGLTWTRTPHAYYLTASVTLTSITTLSTANNKLFGSFYYFDSPYIPKVFIGEMTDFYLVSTNPDYMGTFAPNYLFSGTTSGGQYPVYAYMRIK